MTEWIDMGGQYYNNPFDAGIATINPLSETVFDSTILPILSSTCAASCHQAGGVGSTVAPGTSFKGNRFVLTGSPEGDFERHAVDDLRHLQPGVELPAVASVDGAAPVGCRVGTGAIAGGQRQLQRHQQLDRCRLQRADRQREDEQTMTNNTQRTPRSAATVRGTVAAAAAVLGLASCGGGSNPLDNPSTLQNPTLSGNQRLAFAYFQYCVFPVFLAQLPIRLANGTTAVNTCAASGCHDNTNGTGGAFRVIGNAQAIDLTNPANTADIIRASDMYKNFYSAQGEVVFGNPADVAHPGQADGERRAARWRLGVRERAGCQRATDPVLDQQPGSQRNRTSSTAQPSACSRRADPNTGTCNTQ